MYIHLKNAPFVSMHSDLLRVEQVVIKKRMIYFNLKKIASPCCGDCAPPCNVGRSHTPIILKPLEADGRGGIMVSG
jgi:hypothetical protein